MPQVAVRVLQLAGDENVQLHELAGDENVQLHELAGHQVRISLRCNCSSVWPLVSG
ncbi:MAG: hypothetical protein ABSF23_02135 [Terracidiphilus sp.]